MTQKDIGYATTGDGTRIAYQRTGRHDSRRYVLIHSLAMDGSVWNEVGSILAESGEVVALDCRSHGRSSRMPGPYTPELFADDIAALFDHLGYTDAIVAGCSMGGCVAQAFAAKYPDRVSALALIDTTAWYGADAPEEWRKRAATAKRDGLASMAPFQTTRWFGDKFRAENAERVTAAMGVFIANDIDCYVSTCEMLGDADLRGALSSYKMPVAIAVGEEDYATPVASAQAMADAIKGATLTVLPNARHLTPIECPQQISDLILGLAARI
jgi:3-oxoadipate enol-lactonase